MALVGLAPFSSLAGGKVLSENLPVPRYELLENVRRLQNDADLLQQIKNLQIASKTLIS